MPFETKTKKIVITAELPIFITSCCLWKKRS